MAHSQPLMTTLDLFEGLKPDHVGKVRESYHTVYEGKSAMVVVVTDRISTYDSVHPTGIPDKGRVLNGLSVLWFNTLKHAAVNHLITDDVTKYPAPFSSYPEILSGRSMLVKRLPIFPIEAIVRGYLYGSGLKNYEHDQTVCGIQLPEGLVKASELTKALFTPSTKAETGHDMNVGFLVAAGFVAEFMLKRSWDGSGSDFFRGCMEYGSIEEGYRIMKNMREDSLALYQEAKEFALARGVIIADTKFEYGIGFGGIVLGDEVLTPDSSRFWDAKGYEPGQNQESFDKQFVRDYVDSIGWDHDPETVPPLPEDVVMKTREKYLEAYYRLTGTNL